MSIGRASIEELPKVVFYVYRCNNESYQRIPNNLQKYETRTKGYTTIEKIAFSADTMVIIIYKSIIVERSIMLILIIMVFQIPTGNSRVMLDKMVQLTLYPK